MAVQLVGVTAVCLVAETVQRKAVPMAQRWGAGWAERKEWMLAGTKALRWAAYSVSSKALLWACSWDGLRAALTA